MTSQVESHLVIAGFDEQFFILDNHLVTVFPVLIDNPGSGNSDFSYPQFQG